MEYPKNCNLLKISIFKFFRFNIVRNRGNVNMRLI